MGHSLSLSFLSSFLLFFLFTLFLKPAYSSVSLCTLLFTLLNSDSFIPPLTIPIYTPAHLWIYSIRHLCGSRIMYKIIQIQLKSFIYYSKSTIQHQNVERCDLNGFNCGMVVCARRALSLCYPEFLGF